MKKTIENARLQVMVAKKIKEQLMSGSLANVSAQIEALSSYCNRISTAPSTDLFTDETTKDRIIARLAKLQEVFASLTALSADNSTLSDKEKDREFSKLVDNFNFALGGGDSHYGTTFGEDVARLLNEAGYDKLDNPEMQTLFQLSQACVDSELIWQNAEINGELAKAIEQDEVLEREKQQYQTQKRDVIDRIHQINPGFTGYDLGRYVEATHERVVELQQQLDAINTPEYANSLKETNRQAQQLLLEKEREIKEEMQKITDQENLITAIKDGEYGLEVLQEKGINKLSNLDEKIQNEENAVERYTKELEFARNAKKEVSNAEKELKTANKELSDMIKHYDIEKDYKVYSVMQEQMRYARIALSHMDALMDKEYSKNDYWMALTSKGLIEGMPATGAEYVGGQKQRVDNIIEHYTALRESLLAFGNVDPKAKLDIEKPDAFFKALKTSNDKFTPIPAIINKYKEYLEGFMVKKAIEANKIHADYISKLDNNDVGKVLGAEEKVKKTTENLEQVKARRRDVLSVEMLEENLKEYKQNLETSKVKRKDLASRFLASFGGTEDPEKIKPETLLTMGEEALEKEKTELDNLKKNSTIDKKKTERIAIKEKVEKSSTEVYLETVKKKSLALRQRRTEYDTALPLLNEYGELHEKYDALVKKQKTIKTALTAAKTKDRFSRLADALSTANDHILDATRAISHTNTPEFLLMKGTLEATISVLRDNQKTNDQKLAKIEELNRDSRAYITEKNKQTRLFGGSVMRRARLAFANQLVQLSGTAIQQNNEMKSSRLYSLSEQKQKEPDMKKYREVDDFYQDFALETKAVATQKKQQPQQQREVPNINAPQKSGL